MRDRNYFWVGFLCVVGEKGKLVREEFNWLDEILQKGITKDELETVYRILEKIEKNLTDL